MNPFFLKLHQEDNVLVVTRAIQQGSEILVNGELCTVEMRVPQYFKIASRNIRAGEEIRKFGMCIGVAVLSIGAGQLVHTHNIKSCYLDSFTGNS